MILDPVNIWQKILDELKEKITPKTYQLWFGHTKGLSVEDDTLSVSVPNKYYKDWIQQHYLADIVGALKKTDRPQLKVEFVPTNQEFAQEPAPEPSPELIERFSAKEELRLNPKYTFDSFVVGPSNRFAHAACLAISESPAKAYNPFFIYGGVGLGKTHLMQAIGHFIAKKFPTYKILYISSEKFTNELISAIQNRTTKKFREKYRNLDVLLMDDIHFIAGKESTQEEFFHTFNALYDSHKQIVITSDRSPKEASMEKRIVSRFEWGLITDIQPPDLETRIAIMKKKAQNQNVQFPDDVTYFIAERIKSNIRELEGALIRVVAYSSLIGKPINIDLAKEVLKDAFEEAEKRITIDLIQKKVAAFFDIRLSEMKAKKRTKAIVYPRQVAMYLSRDLTDFSLPEIGEQFGGRDHTTVLHAYEKIQKDISSNRKVKDTINRIISEIKR
jgi:chromosomal replication initiator protein